MDMAALLVAVVSALAAVAAVMYAWRLDGTAREAVEAARASAASSERSAVASEKRMVLESERRRAELTPRFRVTVENANRVIEHLKMTVFLAGPAELGRLDSLTVRIRDDDPWRVEKSPPRVGGPAPEQVAAQVWGPYRFVPGTGPGIGGVLGYPNADETGRVTPWCRMPVGESLPFFLEPTVPPQWSLPWDQWRSERGTVVRLQLDCSLGDESWSLPCEVNVASLPATIEVK